MAMHTVKKETLAENTHTQIGTKKGLGALC